MISIKELLLCENDDIESHLRSRDIDFEKTRVILDKESNVAVFLLFNLSGQLVGYQQYNPKGTKTGNDSRDRDKAKYWTYITKHPEKTIGVWGLETVLDTHDFVFVTEGIFDAVKLHNIGMPAIAVLANHPKMLKPWFAAMNKKVIVVADNDEAGNKLKSVASTSISAPKPYKDLGEMPQKEVRPWLQGLMPELF
jgi:phage/plasmid primase-like uncharacterized protein